FAGTVTMQERDDGTHRVVLVAKGQETKGKGAASATVTSWLEEEGPVTSVKMEADITLSGTVAQLSRGLLPDISARLTHQFAECLRASITAEQEPTAAWISEEGAGPLPSGVGDGMTSGAAPPRPPRQQAIGGIRLGLWALWRAIARFVKRLFGGGR
ncbi:MAG TPA: hypothetical protein VF984_04955, partial [Actinomycetota bacterium]